MNTNTTDTFGIPREVDDYYVPGTLLRQRNRTGRNRRAGVAMRRWLRSFQVAP